MNDVNKPRFVLRQAQNFELMSEWYNGWQSPYPETTLTVDRLNRHFDELDLKTRGILEDVFTLNKKFKEVGKANGVRGTAIASRCRKAFRKIVSMSRMWEAQQIAKLANITSDMKPELNRCPVSLFELKQMRSKLFKLKKYLYPNDK